MSYDDMNNYNGYPQNDNYSSMDPYINQERDSYTGFDIGGDPYVMNVKNPAGIRASFEENLLAQSFVFMAIALVITALSAFYTLHNLNLLYAIASTNLFYALLIGELVIVFANNYTISHNMLVPSAILFTAYSVINGMTLSFIFLVYTATSITTCFVGAATMFGLMAIYGLVTKKDLTGIGNYCLMALIGIIVVTIINMFLGNETLDIVISAIAILVFVGLSAYDVQKIKAYAYNTTIDNVTCIALMCAMEIYLDFINLFLRLLRLFGKRK